MLVVLALLACTGALAENEEDVITVPELLFLGDTLTAVIAPDDAPYTHLSYTIRKEGQPIYYTNGYTLSDGGTFTIFTQLYDPDTYLISIICDWQDEHYQFFSSPEVLLRVVYAGREIPALTIQNASASVPLFGSFAAQAAPLEEADEYIFRIESNDGVLCEVRGSEPAASDVARWYGLVQPGQYTLTAIALCNGFELSRATQPVTVTEAESVLDLPDSLTEIGEEAFAGVDAALVIIPDTCTAIGSRAFAGCANLRYVVLPETVTDIAQDAFDGCDLAEFSRPIE